MGVIPQRKFKLRPLIYQGNTILLDQNEIGIFCVTQEGTKGKERRGRKEDVIFLL
jgi:hypothetical protein